MAPFLIEVLYDLYLDIRELRVPRDIVHGRSKASVMIQTMSH